MKKLAIATFIVIFSVVGTCFFIWDSKASLLKLLMSKQLNKVPINLGNLEITENGLTLKDFSIGNFPKSKTEISLDAKKITINACLKKVINSPLVIDLLSFHNVLITIEYYNESGSENNWQDILKDFEHSKLSIEKDYVINKISLEKLVIQILDNNGKITKYPIGKLELYNISNKLGFPINKIDKAILNTILKAICARLGLDNILDKTNQNKTIVPHFSANSIKELNSGTNP